MSLVRVNRLGVWRSSNGLADRRLSFYGWTIRVPSLETACHRDPPRDACPFSSLDGPTTFFRGAGNFSPIDSLPVSQGEIVVPVFSGAPLLLAGSVPCVAGLELTSLHTEPSPFKNPSIVG
jgi:hypothetical protein